jgi:serine/threonine-protein kinase RsbW
MPNTDTEVHTSWRSVILRRAADAAAVIEAVTSEMAAEGYPQDDVFAVRLALDEAISNAIKHGHRDDPGKNVRVGYHVGPDRTVAEVEDQGPGFDPRAVPNPLAPENLEKPSGRGLFLMRAYLTWCHHNARGNRVTLCKHRSAK